MFGRKEKQFSAEFHSNQLPPKVVKKCFFDACFPHHKDLPRQKANRRRGETHLVNTAKFISRPSASCRILCIITLPSSHRCRIILKIQLLSIAEGKESFKKEWKWNYVLFFVLPVSLFLTLLLSCFPRKSKPKRKLIVAIIRKEREKKMKVFALLKKKSWIELSLRLIILMFLCIHYVSLYISSTLHLITNQNQLNRLLFSDCSFFLQKLPTTHF